VIIKAPIDLNSKKWIPLLSNPAAVSAQRFKALQASGSRMRFS
jgi:hypothetical protein